MSNDWPDRDSRYSAFQPERKIAWMSDDELIAAWCICTTIKESDPWFMAVTEELDRRHISF